MIQLNHIQDYLQKMALIISTVLDMDVLICDSNLNLLGDSCPFEKNSPLLNHIDEKSILFKSMTENRILILKDSKSENEGCRICDKKEFCSTESIIAFPISYENTVVGAIGIYATSPQQKQKLIIQSTSFIDFISRMSELIINNLNQKNQNVTLLAFQKRLSIIIESIDYALIGIDENHEVIHCNDKFKRLFCLDNSMINTMQSIHTHLGNPDFFAFVSGDHLMNKEKQIQFKIKNKITPVLVTFNPIMIDGVYKGALLDFKKISEIYDQVNKFSNNFTSVSFDEIIGNSTLIQKIKNEAFSFSKSTSTLLIQGESGTGKDIFARAIHSASNFKNGPFITVNCASIPDNLLESELFGHEEGAFTGSMKGGRVGKFELANKGTLFLDEIGEMPIHLQPKLLRAIQERKIQRVGGNKDIPITIRIMAATNRNLENMITTGEFREDLYYRLSVIPIMIPSIRERKSDISVLLHYFLTMYNEILDKSILDFSPEALHFLTSYDWPGNVREIQNVVEYAVNLSQKTLIDLCDLPQKIRSVPIGPASIPMMSLKELETLCIKESLHYYGNSLQGKEATAKQLGISRATLYRKLKELNIS